MDNIKDDRYYTNKMMQDSMMFLDYEIGLCTNTEDWF